MKPFYYYIAIITLLDLAGTLSAKFYSINKNPLLLIATIVLFGGAGLTFALSLRYEGVAITNILWIAISIVVVTIMGIFFFKESVAPIQIAGIIVITAGLILVNLK